MRIHEFDNGIKVFDSHLLDDQRTRYARRNVHEEDEEDVFIEAILSLPCDATFVNIGTAIGYYPLVARKVRQDLKIVCFEPLPRHLEFFHANIELNGFEESDFSHFEFAITTQSCHVNLVDNSYGSFIASNSGIADASDRTSINVEAIPLIDVFELIGAPEIDLVQMDIQGHEGPVLASYFSNLNRDAHCIRSFLIGTHGETTHRECRDLLQENGYVLIVDKSHSPNQPDGIIYCKLQKANIS